MEPDRRTGRGTSQDHGILQKRSRRVQPLTSVSDSGPRHVPGRTPLNCDSPRWIPGARAQTWCQIVPISVKSCQQADATWRICCLVRYHSPFANRHSPIDLARLAHNQSLENRAKICQNLPKPAIDRSLHGPCRRRRKESHFSRPPSMARIREAFLCLHSFDCRFGTLCPPQITFAMFHLPF